MNSWLRLAGMSALVACMTAVCLSRTDARTGAPDGWSRHTRGQPFVSQAVLASGPQAWNTWSLSAYQSFVADTPAEKLSVDLTLPQSGRALITPHYRAKHATTALVLEVGSAPKGMHLLLDGVGQALNCTGSAPVLLPGRISVSLAKSASGWTASVGEHTISCATSDGPGQPAVTAGLRRIGIHALSSSGASEGGPGGSALAFGGAVGVAWFALLFVIARFSSHIATAMALGACAGWVLMPIDGARLAEILRLIQVAEDRLALTFGFFVAAVCGAVGLCIRLARTHKPVVAILPAVGLTLGVAAVWPVIGAMGWLYTVFAGLALGGLVWVNVHPGRVRYYNTSALVLALALIGSSEVMIRYTHVGSLWNAADTHHGAGSMGTLIEQFEGMKSGVHSLYPSKGFPVKLQRKNAPLRVACLGASSTGGAFQNDSLDEFYPARLSHMRPAGTEIVNQGVGGWTSFHVRTFLDGHADTLESEVWTIYLGVNENLPTRMSFSDLYAAWQTGGLQQRFDALDKIRLFQGLRLLTRGMQPGAGAGVPPDELRDNLNHIVSLARARGVKVLLMSEGVRPDPRILWHYADVMREVAESGDDVAYLDTASVLDAVGARAFIDSNHLTDLGHRTVAAAMKAELDRLSWW
jgi:hypothetical protein